MIECAKDCTGCMVYDLALVDSAKSDAERAKLLEYGQRGMSASEQAEGLENENAALADFVKGSVTKALDWLDKHEADVKEDLDLVQRTCRGPRERKKYLVAGEVITYCTTETKWLLKILEPLLGAKLR